MYTYSMLLDEMNFLARNGIETGSIGSSESGRMIPYLFVGNHIGDCILITAGIHAREHIGSYLTMRQAEYALNHADALLAGGIYFIPMINPDGNEIAAKGVNSERIKNRMLLNGLLKNRDCRLYKANANGVDLNVNFDAGWGTGKQNRCIPGTENYIGAAPFSESETRALRDFTCFTRPASTVSYHAIGRELYWEYGQTGKVRERDERIAFCLNERLGYKIVGDDKSSAGGYKDWCIEKLKIPAFTVELVSGEHQHPFTDYADAKEDIARNIDLPIRLLKSLHFL